MICMTLNICSDYIKDLNEDGIFMIEDPITGEKSRDPDDLVNTLIFKQVDP